MTNHDLHALAAAPGTVRRKHKRTARPSPDELPRAGHRLLRLTAPPEEKHLIQRINAILEVLAGWRAAGQIRPLVDEALFARLASQQLTRGIHHRVARDLHMCQPTQTALEVSAVVAAGPRVLALAARFERGRAGWVCTRFHVLAPRNGFEQQGKALRRGPGRPPAA
ncbi:Rv3235 family protein [Amycolatopsis benzoatilytica]|uniref:Rv3235 family protein n=1 Tax=Amycolatopsis benzoatilytica TaxID=346045 RepID=UPI0003697AC9|nr:Rv3235 family protein [Amycolatopsis benzoatilytica]